MIIEFQSSPAPINQALRDDVYSKLMQMKEDELDLGKAEVFFSEKRGSKDILKVVEIDLEVSGTSLFVHRESASFEEALQEVIDELAYRIELKKRS